MNYQLLNYAREAQQQSLADLQEKFNEKKETKMTEIDAIGVGDLPIGADMLKGGLTSEPFKQLYQKILTKTTGMSEETAKNLVESVSEEGVKGLLKNDISKGIINKLKATKDNFNEVKNSIKENYKTKLEEFKQQKTEFLKQKKDELDDLKQKLNEAKDSNDEALQEDINGKINDLVDEVKQYKDNFTSKIQGIKDEATDALNKAKSDLEDSIGKLKETGEGVMTKIKNFVSGVKDLKAPDMPKFENIGEYKDYLVNQYKTKLKSVLDEEDNILKSKNEFISDLKNKIRNAGEDEKGGLQEQLDSAVKDLKQTKDSFSEKIESLKSEGMEKYGNIEEDFNNYLEQLKGGIGDKIQDLANIGKEKIVNFIGKFKPSNTSSNTIDDTVDMFKNAVGKIKELPKLGNLDDNVDLAQNLLNNAKSKFVGELDRQLGKVKLPEKISLDLKRKQNLLDDIKRKYEEETSKSPMEQDDDLVRTLQNKLTKANNIVEDAKSTAEDTLQNLQQNVKGKLLNKFNLKESDDGNLEFDIPDVKNAISSIADNFISSSSSSSSSSIASGLTKGLSVLRGESGDINIPGGSVLGELFGKGNKMATSLQDLRNNVAQQTKDYVGKVRATAEEIQQNVNDRASQLNTMIENPQATISQAQEDIIKGATEKAQEAINNASNIDENAVGNVLKKAGEDIGEDIGEDVAEETGSQLLNFVLPGLGALVGAGLLGGQIYGMVHTAQEKGNFHPTSASYQIGT